MKSSQSEVKHLYFQLVLVCILLLLTITSSFAWFSTFFQIEHTDIFANTVARYFESGSGEADDPYIISEPQHLYNLTWLYNKNITEYTKPGVHFKLKNNIDLAGFLGKGQNKTGAIPPIGTALIPFVGCFDGNNHTISNLWISTDPGDWKEAPESLTDTEKEAISASFSGGVGLFGYIIKIDPESGTVSDPVYAINFFLENVEVTVNIPCSAVGIVAGYADADLRNIGVKNAIISFGDNNKAVESKYTLIGKTANENNWYDIPETGPAGGGDLIIVPNGYTKNSVVYAPFVSQAAGTTPVSQSVAGTANYYGSITKVEPSPNPDPQKTGTFYKYTNTVNFDGQTYSNGKALVAISSNTQVVDLWVNPTQNQAGIDPAYIEYIKKTNVTETGKFTAISPNATATFSGVTPNNCIWFKPQTSGTCYVSFIRQNNSSDDTMSIFRFKRNGTNIDITTIQEISFQNQKNAKLGNGAVVLFELEITQAEITAGYEYAIARPTEYNSYAALFFLKLAGTDTHGSGDLPVPGQGKVLNRIEFVPIETPEEFFTSTDYTVSKTVLAFIGQTNTGVQLKFNEIIENGTGIIFYLSPTTPITVTEKVQVNPESQATTDTTKFPPRIKEKPQ